MTQFNNLIINPKSQSPLLLSILCFALFVLLHFLPIPFCPYSAPCICQQYWPIFALGYGISSKLRELSSLETTLFRQRISRLLRQGLGTSFSPLTLLWACVSHGHVFFPTLFYSFSSCLLLCWLRLLLHPCCVLVCVCIYVLTLKGIILITTKIWYILFNI